MLVSPLLASLIVLTSAPATFAVRLETGLTDCPAPEEQAPLGQALGETAEYEMGRLWRDTFADLPRALAVFQEQRARFPNGARSIEADLW